MKYARLVILGEDGENPPQDMPPYFLLTKERTTIGRSRTADMTMDSEAYPWCVGGGCWVFFVWDLFLLPFWFCLFGTCSSLCPSESGGGVLVARGLSRGGPPASRRRARARWRAAPSVFPAVVVSFFFLLFFFFVVYEHESLPLTPPHTHLPP
jgi:protein-S-isoprenylcysteine O-methyltransferase Ste14